LKADNIDEVLR